VAARDDLDVLLVSQFLFDAGPLLDYVRWLRAGGIAAPLLLRLRQHGGDDKVGRSSSAVAQVR
jgi:hypothetical protein